MEGVHVQILMRGLCQGSGEGKPPLILFLSLGKDPTKSGHAAQEPGFTGRVSYPRERESLLHWALRPPTRETLVCLSPPLSPNPTTLHVPVCAGSRESGCQGPRIEQGALPNGRASLDRTRCLHTRALHRPGPASTFLSPPPSELLGRQQHLLSQYLPPGAQPSTTQPEACRLTAAPALAARLLPLPSPLQNPSRPFLASSSQESTEIPCHGWGPHCGPLSQGLCFRPNACALHVTLSQCVSLVFRGF